MLNYSNKEKTRGGVTIEKNATDEVETILTKVTFDFHRFAMDLLAINQKAKGDEENQGPSLASSNRDERILARRLRVDQRILQKRR